MIRYPYLWSISPKHPRNTRARLRLALRDTLTSREMKCYIYAELLRRKRGQK